MPKRRLLLPLAALLVTILLIAACGSDTIPSPSTGEGQGKGDPTPTPSTGKAPCPTLVPPPCYTGPPPTPWPCPGPCSCWYPEPCPTTPEAPEQPWPMPDAQTPLPTRPSAAPTPVPTPDFDPAAYFARSDPTGRNPWRTDFSKHSVDYTEIRHGQVRDGIPSIDNPKFAPVSDDPDWLADREPVIALRTRRRPPVPTPSRS